MGCGGSTVYGEDGGVVAGQGEVNIKWCEEKPVEVGFYYYTEKDAKILVKEFPMDKECAEKQFEDKNVVSSNGGMHWIKVVPGSRYAMKYVEGGHSVGFPGQKALELPKKIHAFHTKDEAATDKLVTDLKKDVEKEEGNAYNAEGADDKIKKDIAALGALGTCADFAPEMNNFKKGCVCAEDLQPWNTINAVLAVKTEIGLWEEKDGALSRTMGMVETGKAMGEKEVAKKGPEITHMGMKKIQGVFCTVIEGAIKGACKKAGPEFEELAPGLKDRIDNMDGCVPGVERAEERKKAEGEAEEEKKEDDADPVQTAALAEYTADKSDDRLTRWKTEDGNRSETKTKAEAILKDVYGSFSTVDAAADADKAVIANIKGFQAPVFVTAVEGDEVTVTTAANNWQDESEIKIPKQCEGTTVNGTTAEDSKVDAFTSLPAATKDDFLERGNSVIVRNKKEFYQGWVKSVEGSTVNVEDQFLVPRVAKPEDCFTHLTQQHIATRGLPVLPKFAPLEFWWVAGEDTEENKIAVRKVRVWRFGAPDTVQEFDLTPKKAKAKPTEAVKEPTNEVHIGFKAEVDILLGAKYAYNFQIGEEFFVDFDKKIENNKGCKVFTCQARVEYA